MWGQRRATHSFNQSGKTRRRRRICTEQLDADQTGTKCGPDGSSSLQGSHLPVFFTCTLEYLSENGWKRQNISFLLSLEVIFLADARKRKCANWAMEPNVPNSL